MFDELVFFDPLETELEPLELEPLEPEPLEPLRFLGDGDPWAVSVKRTKATQKIRKRKNNRRSRIFGDFRLRRPQIK